MLVPVLHSFHIGCVHVPYRFSHLAYNSIAPIRSLQVRLCHYRFNHNIPKLLRQRRIHPGTHVHCKMHQICFLIGMFFVLSSVEELAPYVSC
uniref:Uncharacterized protein n=1 Tax=Rhizophora mucronata TaxID=61149 RepID=A0A2P2JJ78_RHIMU